VRVSPTADERRSFGTLLREHRTAAGLTQEQLADQAGLSVRAITDLERGVRRSPYPDTVQRLATALQLAEPDRTKFLAARRPPSASDPTQRRPGLRLVEGGPRSGGPREDQTLRGRHAVGQPHRQPPLALTSFIGRERELAELLRFLAKCRLLTLTGPGGVGKTRLALEVGRALARDGLEVALVELAAVTGSDLVCHTAAAVLGIQERRGKPRIDTLAEALQARRMLLVLDNCEHVIEPCAQLANALLGSCAELRILTTSREPLGIVGETIWQVPALTVPHHQVQPTVETVAQSEAARLFIDRARSVLPDFTLTSGNVSTVARICQQLDGIPLAVELAAARVRILSTDEIASHLDDSLRLLVRGSRVAPARQLTLRATLDWSHALLEPDEQRLFEQLSVFAGGLTLDAVEMVATAGTGPSDTVVNLLARLVDKSLVLAEHRADGAVRYRLLEVLRQYGREHLTTRGEVASVRHRHAEYFLACVERTSPAYQRPHQAWWFNWVHEELDNLRAALDWAVASGEAGLGLRICAMLLEYWFHVHQTEGQSRLMGLLDLPGAANDLLARAVGLVAVGRLTRERDDLTLARAYGEQGLALMRGIGDRSGLCFALETLGWTVAFQGDWESADVLLEEGLQLGRQLSDLEVGMALGRLGSVRALQGKDAQARMMLEESVATLQTLSADMYSAEYLCGLADIALRQHRNDDARRQALEALDLAHGLVYAWAWETRAIDILVRLASAEHQLERAVRLAGAVSTMHPGLGRLLNRMASPGAVALAERELGPQKAAAAWAEGRAMTREQAVAEAQNM
jgi:predicted ATPase/DNA-binding XRE family transcriptional regulator